MRTEKQEGFNILPVREFGSAPTTTKRNRANWMGVLAGLGLAMNLGCGPRQEIVTISGASTLQPVVTQAGVELERIHPQYRFEVSGGGTSKGKKDVTEGISQAGMIAVDLSPEEISKYRVFPIATDGVAVITHSANPLERISKGQLRQIYQHRIKNWQEINGIEAIPVVVKKAVGHGTLPAFADYLGVTIGDLHADVIAGDNSQVIMTVESAPSAIGFVSLGEALNAVARGRKIKLLAIDGVSPTVEGVASGRYPIKLKLSLITQGEPSPGIRLLLNYMVTESGTQQIKSANYVPLL